MGVAAAIAGSLAAWSAVGGSPAATSASASVAPPPMVAAAVDATGVPAGAGEPSWTVERIDVGVYDVQFPEPTRLAVQTWTATATVTARPLTPARWVVSFADADEHPVDSAFSFVASPLP